jgi:hypothetical protein
VLEATARRSDAGHPPLTKHIRETHMKIALLAAALTASLLLAGCVVESSDDDSDDSAQEADDQDQAGSPEPGPQRIKCVTGPNYTVICWCEETCQPDD